MHIWQLVITVQLGFECDSGYLNPGLTEQSVTLLVAKPGPPEPYMFNTHTRNSQKERRKALQCGVGTRVPSSYWKELEPSVDPLDWSVLPFYCPSTALVLPQYCPSTTLVLKKGLEPSVDSLDWWHVFLGSPCTKE